LTEWRVFDCRHDLIKAELGALQYRESHIPGATFASFEHDLSAPKTGKNGRHPLPAAETFIAWLGRQGVRPDDQVVCYDAGNGSMAARLWWMLRWVGHGSVAVLDGGLAKWVKEGRAVDAIVPQPKPTTYPAKRATGTLDAQTVNANLKNLFLLDARAPARYRGEQEPIDPVAGHVPGACNRPFSANVTMAGFFRPAAELRMELLDLLRERQPHQLVAMCGSGVTACHLLLAMAAAGLTGGKLYAGSWSEWIRDPARPIRTGNEP
jgi:thiosulfate/3-mercaptopyruvate sulfurtransferase